ncbi:MAG: T9SS type A sorting domain-containing protein [Bacteroidia bacterium]
MKKSLLTVSLSIATVAAMAQAVCTADVSCLPPTQTGGVCPDSASAIPLLTGTVGSPLTVTFSVKIPASTTYSGQTVTLNQFAVTNIEAKVNGAFGPLSAVGMNYLGAGTNSPTSGSGPSGVTMTKFCYFPAPATAGKCIVVSGTPTVAGVFPIKISSQARGVIFGSTIWAPAPDDNSYYLTINAGPNGLNSTLVNSAKFGVIAANPNPFADNTTILYNSPEVAKTTFTVFNVLGEQVYTNVYTAQSGQNAIEFKANNLTSGVYVYTLTNGKETTTQRFVIEK